MNFAHPNGQATWRLTGADGVDEEVQVVARFNGNTVQALRKATVAGLGIALLTHTITAFDLQAGRLVPVLNVL